MLDTNNASISLSKQNSVLLYSENKKKTTKFSCCGGGVGVFVGGGGGGFFWFFVGVFGVFFCGLLVWGFFVCFGGFFWEKPKVGGSGAPPWLAGRCPLCPPRRGAGTRGTFVAQDAVDAVLGLLVAVLVLLVAVVVVLLLAEFDAEHAANRTH